jgi:hypothetical protein
MDASTAARIATVQQLRNALRRAPAPGPNDGAVPGPIGNCGRDSTKSCGMIDPQECAVHADPAPSDPEALAFAGTRLQRLRQLKDSRRQGLRF